MKYWGILPVSYTHLDVYKRQVLEKTEQQRKKYIQSQPKAIKYKVGEKVLIRNREVPSAIQGITRKLLLLYTGPFTITSDNKNNTYEVTDTIRSKVKETYNQTSLKKYHD